MYRKRWHVAWAVLACVAVASPALALDMEQFEKNLTMRKLDNGLTLMIYERPVAPVVSFVTYVNVGAAQEVPGITGLAHMFEHMAFKGTTRIGTKNAKAEAEAMAEVDAAYAAYERERRKQGGPDPDRLEALKTAWKDAEETAQEFVIKNEFDEIVNRAGGTGMNAGTGADSTVYMFSLPANKVELWAYLESERFLDPVFREFYEERDVVMEERRMRVESQPIGRGIEQLLATAYSAHPYGQPIVGYSSDLETFTRQDAREFYEKHYVPANMVVAVVGDVDAEAILPMLEKYFGRLPKKAPPEPNRTVEPKQVAEKIVAMQDPSQPFYVEAYHRPAATDSDDAVYDAIVDVLSNGRTSRMYRRLVRDDKIAAAAGVFQGFPGDKYPSLLLLFAITSPDGTNAQVATAFEEEIARIKTEPISDEELQMVKTRAKADLIRGMSSNMGIAMQLAEYQTMFGDWRELFRNVERIDKVTKEDILRVAQATFVKTNRTVAYIENEEDAQ